MKNLFIVICLTFNLLVFAERGDEIYYDTITFENYYKYLQIDTSAQCIWDIASPQKSFFSEAYSGEKVILTDSINSYPINNLSFFELKVGLFNQDGYYNSFFFEFTHKFDTDSLLDGGYITFSIDTGKTWTNILSKENNLSFDINPFSSRWVPYSLNMYSNELKLSNNECGFSGNSNGWVVSRFGWAHEPVKKLSQQSLSDTLLLRFNFVSDDIDTEKEGWMIDDIKLLEVDMGTDVQLQNSGLTINVFPNPTTGNLNIELNDTHQQVALELFTPSGAMVFSELFYGVSKISVDDLQLDPGMHILNIRLNETYIIQKQIFIN